MLYRAGLFRTGLFRAGACVALVSLLSVAGASAQEAQPREGAPQPAPARTADPESYPGRQEGEAQPVPGAAGTPPPGRGQPDGSGEAITAKEDLRGRSTMSREPQTGIPGAEAPGQESQRRGLRDQDVKDTQLGQPSQQGVRSPEVQQAGATNGLFKALAAVRRAPPGLDGVPIPRPNEVASEPEVDWEQSDSPNPSEQTSREVQ